MEGDMREAWPIIICKPDPYCKGCRHYKGSENGKGYGLKTCMYWSDEDKLRGCPPGKDCIHYSSEKLTRKESRFKEYNPRKSRWDIDYGYRLWLEGKHYFEIAEICCVSNTTVFDSYPGWRKRAIEEGKERNYTERRGRKKRNA